MVAPVHIEYFSSVDAIAHEKGAIFEGLTHDGVAVINADESYADFWKKQSGDRFVMTFGYRQKADVMAHDLQSTAEGKTIFTLVFGHQQTSITLPEKSLSIEFLISVVISETSPRYITPCRRSPVSWSAA